MKQQILWVVETRFGDGEWSMEACATTREAARSRARQVFGPLWEARIVKYIRSE